MASESVRLSPSRASRPRKTYHENGAHAAAAAILRVVAAIPRGRVASYGQVARLAGLPRRARLVGAVLRAAPATPGLPWHRVLNAAGRIALPDGSPAAREQRRRLRAEGVAFVRGRVDLERYAWRPHDASPLLD
ncbi:MAG: MGMT family protein [Nevskia sp.]|nr:MGMT family protein [Nevskia sp.]